MGGVSGLSLFGTLSAPSSITIADAANGEAKSTVFVSYSFLFDTVFVDNAGETHYTRFYS